MIPYTIPSLVLLLILAVALWRKPFATYLANNAQIVNITHKGKGTKLASPTVTFPQRYLVASRDQTGAGQQYIQPYVAGTVPYAVVDDMSPTMDLVPSSYPLDPNILGACEDTKRLIAAGVIGVDQEVYPIAGGTVAAIAQAGAGTYYVIGKCLVATNNGAGDQVEVVTCYPRQVTVA